MCAEDHLLVEESLVLVAILCIHLIPNFSVHLVLDVDKIEEVEIDLLASALGCELPIDALQAVETKVHQLNVKVVIGGHMPDPILLTRSWYSHLIDIVVDRVDFCLPFATKMQDEGLSISRTRTVLHEKMR